MISPAGRSGFDVRIESLISSATARLSGTSLRLATLQRINRGSDDPAGLIAAEQLNRDLAVFEQVDASLEYSQAMTAAADSVLAEASTLVSTIDAKVVAAANDTLSIDQREALQLEVNAAVESLNRLGQTSFAGNALFGRTFEFLVGTSPDQTASLQLPAMDSSLGGASGTLSDLVSGGSANLVNGDREQAANILAETRSQITSARSSLGDFDRSSLESARRLNQEMHANTSSALSAIQDADVAAESSRLVRDLILADTTIAAAKLGMRARRSLLSLVGS